MALIAVHAVVDISADSPVIRVRLRLGMAVGALKDCVITRIGVARGAHASRVAVIGWKVSVVECGPRPGRGRMTRLARCRKSRGLMIWICRIVVVRLMAANAGRRQRRVVVIDVTAGARRGCMRSRQWECGRIVVERRRNPCSGIVADLALLRKPDLRMIWACRRVEILLVTTEACCARRAVVGMTLRALQRRMGPGQGKTCRVMVEGGT